MAGLNAITQAEQELRAALQIGPPDFVPGANGTQMNILGGDTDANAYLFSVSTVLAQSARMTSTGGEDATLQELANGIARDLAADGMIDVDTVRSLRAAQAAVDPKGVMDMLKARLTALKSDAAVPDLDRMLDTDLDGVMNADDNCRWTENTDQADADSDGIGDACECGNGTVEHGEECDDGGESETCNADCTTAVCGDERVNAAADEECDDGNLIDEDGCDSNCRPTGCGNGRVTTGEACDDGNLTNGDGCDSNCRMTGCGNGIRTTGEQCDDGNLTSGDGCDSNCTVTGCGNGVVTAGEDCDTGIATGPGSCPTLAGCNDFQGCTEDSVTGEGCQQHCVHTTTITE
ncbi:MAG: hypothetical protein V2A73_20070 [Pseudomonadota bacterium]